MKKIGLVLCAFISVSALAFSGGGGGGGVATVYKNGVDAIGVHFGGTEIPCPEHSTKIEGLCACDEGYVSNEEGICVANQCLNYEPTDCLPDCEPISGTPVAGNEGEYCENKTGICHGGVCEPIVCDACQDLVEGVCEARTCGDYQFCDEAKDACVCDGAQAVSCDDGNGNTWCCGDGLICDSFVGTCRPAQTNCSYDLTQEESGYAADCHYTIEDYVPDPTNAPNVHAITLTADVQHKCKSDKYCYLYYKDENCGAAADANAGSSTTNRDLWGVCISKDQVNQTCRTTGGEVSLTRHTGCPAGSYCYLNWTQVSADQGACSSNVAGADYLGTFWGTCISTNSNSAACPVTN